jgi:uncharacterized protein
MKDVMIVPIQIKATSEDDGYYYIDALASTYGNIDRGGDRCIDGCFKQDLKAEGNERPCLWMHDMKQPIGLNTYTDSIQGLMFTAKLPKGDDLVEKRVMPQIKVGSVNSASIGYDTIESEYNATDKCFDLKTLKLWETSFITIPMNPKARILSVRKCLNDVDNSEYKSMTTKQKDYLKTLVEDVKDLENETINYDLCDVNTEWNTSKTLELIKSNKIPYLNDDNKIVPKALYTLVGILAGNKKIKIDNEDNLKKQVNACYKKLGKEIPFKDDGKIFIDIETLKEFSHIDKLKIFDEDVILSNNAKEFIVNSFGKPVEVERNNNSDSLKQFVELLKQEEIKWLTK